MFESSITRFHFAASLFAKAVASSVVPRFPYRLFDADHGRAVDLGQAIDMREVEAETLQAFDHRSRWRRTGHHRLDAAGQVALHVLGVR